MHQDLQRSPNKTGILLSTQKDHSSSTKTHHGQKRTLTARLMGSYDGAETCELIGVYMLSLIAPKFKDEVGLYRNDGIAVQAVHEAKQ